MNETDRLLMIADFLDKEGLIVEADYVDSLIKRAADPEVPSENKEPALEVDEGTEIQNGISEIGKTKRRFVEKFYKKLLEIHNKIRDAVNEDDFGYLGDERRQILKMSFDALINAMEEEFRKFQIETVASPKFGKMIDNTQVIKDVYKLFTPIIDLYEAFDRFMISYPEFANKFPRTKAAFLNLKNVVNNIIKGVPEEILDIDLTKK